MFDYLKNPNLHRKVTSKGLGDIQESSFGGLMKSGKYDAVSLPAEMQNSLIDQETSKLLHSNYIKFQGLLKLKAIELSFLDDNGNFNKETKEQIELIKENIYKLPLFHATPNKEPASNHYINPESTLGNIVQAGGLLSHQGVLEKNLISEDKGTTEDDDKKTGRDKFVYFMIGFVYSTATKGADSLILAVDGNKLHNPCYIVQCKSLEKLDPRLGVNRFQEFDNYNRSSMLAEDFVNIFATSVALGILKSEDIKSAEVMVKDKVPFDEFSYVIQTQDDQPLSSFNTQLKDYTSEENENKKNKIKIPPIIELSNDTLHDKLEIVPNDLNTKNQGNWYDDL